MSSFQSNGDWWIPGSSEKVSGTVTFDPTEGVTLELNGSLEFEENESEGILQVGPSTDYSLLYGDLGRNGLVTVQNAAMTSFRSGGQSISEEYYAQRMLIGEHLPETPYFKRADFL